MGTTSLEYEDEAPCRECGFAFPIGKEACPACGTAHFRLHSGEFFAKIEHQEIIDARFGGLVLGGSGTEDDIPMFQFVGGGVFEVIALMHGWEYVLSAQATHLHRDRLEEINSETGTVVLGDMGPALSARSMVLNCDLVDRTRGGLWFDQRGQFIINAFATAKHIEELERMNYEAMAFGQH